MKKILGIVLAFVMLVTVLAIIPAAQEAAQEDGYYVYLDEGITLVKVKGGVEYEVSVAAKDLGTFPTFTDGSTSDYSVHTYLDALLEKDQPKFLEDLMIALLNYGAAAQQYFDEAGELAGTPVTNTADLKAATAPKVDVKDDAGIYIGATLILEGTIQLRFYFRGTDITATVGGKAAEVETGNGYSYVDVPVMPYAMSESVTVTVGTTSVTYAPINYLKNQADNPELSTMVASMYAYGVAAKAYADHKHIYDGDPIIIDATCGKDGSETKTCSCGYVDVKILPATGKHTFDNDALIDDWYITKVGEEYYKTCYCNSCELMQVEGKYYNVKETKDATGRVTNVEKIENEDYKFIEDNANELLDNSGQLSGSTTLASNPNSYGNPGAYPIADQHPRLLLNNDTVNSIKEQIAAGDSELIKILADIADNANFWYYEKDNEPVWEKDKEGYYKLDKDGNKIPVYEEDGKTQKTERVGLYKSSRESANLGTSSNPTYKVFSPDSGAHNYNPQILNSIMAKAFLYLYTGVDLYAIEATANIKEYLKSLSLSSDVSDNCRYWGYAMFAAAIVYDWCYHGMADADRTEIVKGIQTISKNMEVGSPPSKQYAVSGHGCEYQILRDYLAVSLAIYDEYPDWYKYVGGRVYNEYVPVRESFYEAGMVPQGVSIYAGIRFTSDLWSAWLLQSATGVNPYEESGQDQVIRSIFSRVIDGAYYFFDEGDDKRGITAWGQGELNRYVVAANISAYLYNDATAAAWAAGAKWNDNDSDWVYKDNVNVFRIIYRSNNDTVSNEGSRHEGLDLILYNGGFMNEIVAHTGWTSSDVSVLMKIGGYSAGNHDHGDAGSFQIYYKGMLAGDTGFYNSYDSDHHRYYHQATIAHNSIVVYDGNSAYGQLTGMEISDAMPKSSWMSSSTKTATLTGVSTGYDVTGKNPRYAYISGDISNQYYKQNKFMGATISKTALLNKADRRMLSVFNTGNADVPMYFFVYDRVNSKSDYQIAFLLHTAAKPSYTTINGKNAITVNSGGKYSGGQLVLQNILGWSEKAEYSGNQKYMVNGTNYSTGTAGNDNSDDCYWGRIEIKTASGTDHTMLNVMYVTDSGKTLSLPATPITLNATENGVVADGAAIGNTVAIFLKNDTNYYGGLTFTAPDTGAGTKVNYYISGMKAGKYTIECHGQVINATVDEKEGILVFNTYAGEKVVITTGHSTGTPSTGTGSENELPMHK